MDSPLLVRNRSVQRVIVGIPEGGRGVQARLVTQEGDVVVVPESALLALVRGWTAVATHPNRRAVELRAADVQDSKDGTHYHLIEAPADEVSLRRELGAGPPPTAQPMLAPDGVPTWSGAPAPPGPYFSTDEPMDHGPPSVIVPAVVADVSSSTDGPIRPPPLPMGSLSPPNLDALRRGVFEETSGHEPPSDNGPTSPHRPPRPTTSQGPPRDEGDDLVLDDALEADDGPVFGAVPTFGGKDARGPRKG
jgi:hypothetical protein